MDKISGKCDFKRYFALKHLYSYFRGNKRMFALVVTTFYDHRLVKC